MYRLQMIKKYISILLIFTLVFSSFSFSTFATVDDAEVNEWLNKAIQNATLRKFTWKDDSGTEQEAYFMDLPDESRSPQFSGMIYDGNGNGGQTLYYYDQSVQPPKRYSCKLDVKINGESILMRDAFHDFSNGYGNMIEINPAFVTDSKGNLVASLDPYQNGNLEISVTVLDENGVATNSYTQEKTLGQDNLKEETLDKNSPLWEMFKTLLGWLFKPVELALRLLEIVLNGLILASADGALASLSNAVGEPITFDRVIFGQVEKLNIDFWNNSGSGLLKSLSGTVDYWYGIFSEIASLVYLAMLLWIGIKILWASTANGRAKYKVLLKDWIVGMAILFLFPYVMEAIVNINNGLIDKISASGEMAPMKVVEDDESISDTFGTDDFVNEMLPEGASMTDDANGRKYTMLYIRYLAGKQKRIPLTFVYCIMIAQLYVIVCVYYKRAFMLAFLITIFPLVALTYILDKARWRRYENRSFWKMV